MDVSIFIAKLLSILYLIVGIGMALRVSELVGLKVGDVYDGKQKQVKTHVTIRGATAKFNKSRTIRVWDIVQDKLEEFIHWKKEKRESLRLSTPLFVSREGGHLTTKALYFLVKKILEKDKKIKVNIKFFANIKEITSTSSIDMELPEGTPIRILLEELYNIYDLRNVIIDKNNQVNPYINIIKNGRQIKFLDGLKTQLKDGDIVAIFPPVAGG